MESGCSGTVFRDGIWKGTHFRMHVQGLSLGTQQIKIKSRGTWVAQSVGCPTSALVTISRLMGSSPTSGSVPTAQSLEPASDSVSLSLSPKTPTHTLSLSIYKL